MYKDILKIISKYDSIVIFRHSKPDMDALGSQFGLKHLINQNFTEKKVYVVGDTNKYTFLGGMDIVDDQTIKESLAIILDVAVVEMISDERYNIAKEIIVIDHHKNECNVDKAKVFVDNTAAACAQLIAQFAKENDLIVNSLAANALYSGIITDTGRFMYSLNQKLFETVSFLISKGVDYQNIYQNLYSETVLDRKMKAYFTSKFEVNKYGVAYLFNPPEVFDIFKTDVFNISRGMVGVMANLEEVKIWANFTYDPQSGKILGEFRSKKIEIVEVAKKYGGGGHLLACGATLSSFEEAKQVIEDFNKLIKE